MASNSSLGAALGGEGTADKIPQQKQLRRCVQRARAQRSVGRVPLATATRVDQRPWPAIRYVCAARRRLDAGAVPPSRGVPRRRPLHPRLRRKAATFVCT